MMQRTLEPTAGSPTSGAVDRIAPFALAAVAVAVALLTVTPWPVGVFQDDAIYVVLAKALASGQGFRMINMPGAPHATHFPPGYPLFLAALWRLYPSFPDNIVLFKFANTIFLAATAYGTYVFARVRLGLGIAGASVAATVGTLSVVILLITGVVLSEPLYMALLVPTLLAAERTADEAHTRQAIVTGALIGVLSLVRTVGVFALPAALVVLALRRRWRDAVALALAALVFIIPWQLWVSAYQGEVPGAFVGKYGAYGSWLVAGYKAGGLPFARAVLAKKRGRAVRFSRLRDATRRPCGPPSRVVRYGTRRACARRASGVAAGTRYARVHRRVRCRDPRVAVRADAVCARLVAGPRRALRRRRSRDLGLASVQLGAAGGESGRPGVRRARHCRIRRIQRPRRAGEVVG
jgi:hypothetical protein